MKSNIYLWQRFKKGDDEALSLLFKMYADELYSYGLKIVKDESLVKDCLQETFIQLIDKRKFLEITPNIHLYLFKTLRNKLFEELRLKNRRKNIIQLVSETEEKTDNNIEQSMIQSEERNIKIKRLNRVLEELTGHQKEVIFLKFKKGLSNTEIAEMMQIDNSSVRTLLYRTLKTIKSLLKKNVVIKKTGRDKSAVKAARIFYS